MRKRQGMGSVLIMVSLLLFLLGTLGISSACQTGGTTRTYRKLMAGQVALTGGDSGLAEATGYIRKSATEGGPAGNSTDDWQAIFNQLLRDPANIPVAQPIPPTVARSLYAASEPPVTLSDVKVKVVEMVPGANGGLPQGVLELSVEVSAPGLHRTIRERRAFYLCDDTGARAADPADARAHVLLEPLVRMVE